MFQMKVRIQNRIQTSRSTWQARQAMPSSIQTARSRTGCRDWICRIRNSWPSSRDPVTSWRYASRKWWTAWSVRSPVRTRDAQRCSGTTAQCASICTRTGPGCTYAPSAARRSSKVPNSNGINWCIRARNRFSVRSRDAGRGSVSTLIYAHTWEFIPATGRTSVPSTDAVKSSRNRRTSNPIYWLTRKPSKSLLSCHTKFDTRQEIDVKTL